MPIETNSYCEFRYQIGYIRMASDIIWFWGIWKYSQKDQTDKNNNTKRFYFFRKTEISSFNRWRCMCVVRSVTAVGFDCGYVDANICTPLKIPKEFAEHWQFVSSHSQADGITQSSWTNCFHLFWRVFSIFHRNRIVIYLLLHLRFENSYTIDITFYIAKKIVVQIF